MRMSPESTASREIERAREFWDRSFKEVAPDVRDAPPGRDLSDIVGRLRATSAVDGRIRDSHLLRSDVKARQGELTADSLRPRSDAASETRRSG
jgi:hypothetical protein